MSEPLGNTEELKCPDDVYEEAIQAYAQANRNGSCPDHCVAMACEVLWKAKKRDLTWLDDEMVVEEVARAISEDYGTKPDGSLYKSNFLYAKAAIAAIKRMGNQQ